MPLNLPPEGGSILVSAQNIGGKIKITVSDTGIGIKTEDLEKVFLAFEQAEASYTRRYKGAGPGIGDN